MSSLVELASLRHLTRHPAQLLCAVLGLALGVAAVVGIDLAIDSTARAFELTTLAVTGRATHTLRAGPNGIDEARYVELVRAHPTIRFAPILEREVRTAEGERRRFTLIGVDALAQAALWPWIPPPGNERGLEAAAADDVWLAASTASELGLAQGSDFEIEIESWRAKVRVAGLIEPTDPLSAQGLRGVMLTDIAIAQELARARGRLSRIDFAAGGDADLAELRADLPRELSLESADTRRSELAGMSDALRFNLRVLSWLALFVGAFLVYDAITFSVVQRRELFGRLRALGAGRASIFGAVCGEAAWIGLVGSALGLLLGDWLARAIVPLFARTLNDMYATVGAVEVSLSPRILFEGALFGLLATQLAAFLPALEAASAPPRTTMTRSRLEESVSRFAVPLGLGSLACAALALVLVLVTSDSLAASFAALGLGLAAVPLAAPWVVSRAARIAAPLAGRAFGSIGRIAARSIGASLSRTSVAVAALTIALGTALAMGASIASFRTTLEDWLALTLRADVFVIAPHLVISRSTSSLDPALVERLRRLPGIDSLSAQRGFELSNSLGAVYLIAIDEPAAGRLKYRFLRGEPREVWSAFDRGAVIVSESFARRHALDLASSIELPTDRGARRFAIAGVFQDFTSEQGYVAMSRGTFESSWDDRGVSSLAFYLARGVDPAAFARSVEHEFGPDDHVNVYSNRALRDGSLLIFDQTFAVALALELLATVIAAIACVSSLAALEFERAGELALLRAEGLTRGAAFRLIALRSALLGAFAGTFAIPVGLLTSGLLVDVVQPRAFGWTLDWHFESALSARTFALSVAAALGAALLPAWSAVRSNPAGVLRAE